MNVDTGELRNFTSDEEMELLRQAGFVQVPEHLQKAAQLKLSGKESAKVSLTSGGKLSKWAAKQRKIARKKKAKSRIKKNRQYMAKASRKRNRRITG